MPELTPDPERLTEPQAAPQKSSRRQMLMTLGIALNAVASVLFAVPVVGYIFGPSKRRSRWRTSSSRAARAASGS